MRKFLLLLTVVLMATSCNMFTGESGRTAIFTEPAKNIIKFRENTIRLPRGYVKMAIEEFKVQFDSIQDKPKTKEFAFTELKKIEDKKSDFQIFVDEKNIENYVFVYACDFYQFDEQRAAEHVAQISNELKKESKKQKIYYRRIHGRYFYTPMSKIVKIKYLRAYKKEKRYQTEYIVASKTGGIGLLVSNTENIDFEDSVKNSLVANK